MAWLRKYLTPPEPEPAILEPPRAPRVAGPRPPPPPDAVGEAPTGGTPTGGAPPPVAPGFNESLFRSAWMGNPDTSAAGLAAFLPAHPEFATGVNLTGSSGGDKVRLPDGRVIDLIVDVGTTNRPWWGPIEEGGGPSQLQGNLFGGGAPRPGLNLPLPSQQLGGTDGGAGGPDWLDDSLKQFYQSNVEGMNKPVSSAQFEALRQPIDKARRTSLAQVRAGMADRGTLLGGGDYTNALSRVEERLAPDFATAVQNAAVQNVQGARGGALGALQAGGQLKAISGDLALRRLDQNRQWQQFLGAYGLQRAQVEDMIQSGRIDQLLRLFELFQQGVETSAGGYIE